jgi:hypothetical protein
MSHPGGELGTAEPEGEPDPGVGAVAFGLAVAFQLAQEPGQPAAGVIECLA